MKKLILPVIGVVILLAACKKNGSDDITINKNKLYGRWSEVLDITHHKGSNVPDSTFFDPNQPFIWVYDSTHFVRIGYSQIPDTGLYTITGTTLNWFSGPGTNPFYKQNIDVLNDTMLVLHYSDTSSLQVISFFKRL
ncbi:hypothetical protein [Taibaiella soli]|uniref:Lipocalin-like domain-containing protein n=1 Tax=Taibaiella soli TaxID=1649169 RepID=A0A2W2BEA6_9BACT|nr:hypothetical protein [Taibaiella soli]PZF74599.1 hypothetical protein DN068_03205 [Taibaiella soli]